MTRPLAARTLHIRALLEGGLFFRRVAERTGASYEWVRFVARRDKLPINRRVHVGGRRERDIVMLAEQSVPAEAIGKLFSLATVYVEHIIESVKKRTHEHGPLRATRRSGLMSVTGARFRTKPPSFHEMPTWQHTPEVSK